MGKANARVPRGSQAGHHRAGQRRRGLDVRTCFACRPSGRKSSHCDKAKYQAMYERSIKDPDGFWAEMAKRLDWYKSRPGSRTPPSTATSGSAGTGTASSTSATTASTGTSPQRGDQTAIIWEGDDPEVDKKITYGELHEKVCRLANVLKEHGRQEGRPGHHLPADDPRGGLRDAGLRPHRRRPLGRLRRLLARQPRRPHQRLPSSKLIITADGGLRGGRAVPLKGNADKALEQCDAGRQDAGVPPHRHERADEGGPRLRRRQADAARPAPTARPSR